METLRDLLIQRAARLQERPALTTPDWGTLRYPAFRNRVEGIALGLMAAPPADARTGAAGAGPWAWAAEVAAACCGLAWDPALGSDPALLGGPRFNDEGGRQAYHDRGEALEAATPFLPGLGHGDLLLRLRRLNGRLGWDHETRVQVPLADLASPAVRGVLWSALYAGAHAVLHPGPPAGWDPAPFQDLLQPGP